MGIGMLIAFGLLIVRLYDLQINLKENFVRQKRAATANSRATSRPAGA